MIKLNKGDKILHDVFISYASQDEFLVHEIVQGLEEKGLSCWIASSSITPSNAYATEIRERASFILFELE